MNLLALAFLLAQQFPPAIPGGKEVATDGGEALLKPAPSLKSGVAIAKTPPEVDFMYFPEQNYPGKPWSAWGDSVFANGKFYCSIGDHHALGARGTVPSPGNAFVFEYDPATKKLRKLVEVKKLLGMPEGHYTPGKIHGRLDLGDDGWLYFSTHRGSARATTDAFHYKGDWILRVNPASGASEVVACGPVSKHCIPTSVLDPKRLIFYGGTAAGTKEDDEGVQFFAYDIQSKKVLYSGPDGPSRYMIFARSTGKVYWVPGKDDMVGPVVRFDPDKPGPPVKIDATLGLRAATQETADGMIYTVAKGGRGPSPMIYAFNVKTEKAEVLGEAAVGTHGYIGSLDVDPSGRYLYYTPGAHGGSEQDGTPIVQFDVKTKQKKVIAFLHPFCKERFGGAPVGTYSSALDDKGETLYVVWNTRREGAKAWDCVSLTAIRIPASERP